MHTHTEVTRDQFDVRADLVIHTPTGAEFAPHSEKEDSVLVWTGEIGSRLSSGEFYQYGEGTSGNEGHLARTLEASGGFSLYLLKWSRQRLRVLSS